MLQPDEAASTARLSPNDPYMVFPVQTGIYKAPEKVVRTLDLALLASDTEKTLPKSHYYFQQ